MKRILMAASIVAVAAAAMPASGQDADSGARGRLRQACGADFQQYCADVPAGGGGRIKCLRDHDDKISAGCKAALSELPARRTGQGSADSKGSGSSAAPTDQN